MECQKYHGMSQGDTDNDHPILDGSQDSPVVKPVTKQVQCAEDEDFMAAFDKMLSESILVSFLQHTEYVYQKFSI